MRRLVPATCAFTINEMVVSLAVSSAMVAGLVVGAVSLQKSFLASRHHVDAQAQQLRLIDYINLDLRRALAVNTNNGRLTITMPDYYGTDGKPRDPQISRGLALYGPNPKVVSYYKQGNSIFRSEAGQADVALASDVADFQLAFQDLGQSIRVSVSFLPRFQLSSRNFEGVRDMTTTFSTTLLRNKRQQ